LVYAVHIPEVIGHRDTAATVSVDGSIRQRESRVEGRIAWHHRILAQVQLTAGVLIAGTIHHQASGSWLRPGVCDHRFRHRFVLAPGWDLVVS